MLFRRGCMEALIVEKEELYAKLDSWVARHKEEYLKDVSDLVRIPSVATDEPEGDMPFGKACYDVLQASLALSEKYGFTTKNYDNYCGSAVYGDCKDSIGIVGHMDIVPQGEGWTTDPFRTVISEDGKYIFGRGTADNKAPALVGLYAMRFLKEHNIRLRHNVMMVYGCNEEKGMVDMPEFLKREKAPVFTLIPDSKYPVGYYEMSMFDVTLVSPKLDGNLKDLWAGLAVNAESPKAFAVLSGLDAAAAEKALAGREKLWAEDVDGGVKVWAEKDANEGKESPVTALYRLCGALVDTGLVTGNGREALDYIRKVSVDKKGTGFGIACRDEVIGDMLSRCSFVRVEEGAVVFRPDIRYPVLVDWKGIKENLDRSVKGSPFTMTHFANNPGQYISLDHPVVQKLLEISREMLGQPDIEPIATYGGSYARKLPNAVTYGVTVPGRVRLFGFEKGGAHQADEYGDINNLMLNIKIYVRTLIEIDQLLD